MKTLLCVIAGRIGALAAKVFRSASLRKDGPCPDLSAVRRALLVLTGCLALQSTGVSVLVPAFARKIGALGHGVEVFGISATAFSLAALVGAPVMGMLADRFGRRRLLLGALAVHSLVCLGEC